MDIVLRIGDQLPVVASAQILLKRFVDPNLRVTGLFDSMTQETILKIKTFQSQRTISGPVWLFLLQKSNLKVVDVIDGADPAQVSTISAISDCQSAYAGAHMINKRASTNSIGDVMKEITKLIPPSSLLLLRFHGHGAPGYQGVSCGQTYSPKEKNSINIDYINDITLDLQTLWPCFAPFGSVELHGCNTGKDQKGAQLLQKLADLWQIPVSAGTKAQVSGGMDDTTFRFEGNPVSKMPSGQSLTKWATSVQHLHIFIR